MQMLEMAVTGSLMDEIPNQGPGKSKQYSLRDRANGKDWPAAGHTMVGHMRLRNIHESIARVLQDGVPGPGRFR